MIIALVFGLLQSIFTAFSLLATAYALQNMIEGTASMSTVWSAFGIVGGGVLLAAVCNYFSTQFLTYAGYTIAANARIRIADKLKYAPMGYFNEHNLGQIANTATNTAESLQDTLTRCLLLTTKGLFMALVITISLLVFDWRIGLVAACGFVLFLVINHFLHKAGEKNSDRKTVSGDRAVEAVLEYVQGIAVIKSYNLTGKANKKVTSAIKEDRDVNYALEKNYIPFMALQGIAVKLAGVAIIAVSVWFYTQLSMPLFTALVACIASFMVFNDLDSGGNMSALLRTAANSIDKIEAAMNLPVMDINGKEITPAKTDISVQNVDFSYDKRKIIDGVTADIPARSSLAIVGGSGSGKTTLCNLILRFWDVDKGSISLGGHDVREYKLDSLLKNYSMVFQNVYLFNDTIANNIRFGKPDASMEEVIEAAKKACCHDFIMRLPIACYFILRYAGDLFQPSDVGTQRLGNGDRTVGVLIIFHERDQRAPNREAGTVQCVDEARLAAVGRLVLHTHAACLEILAIAAGADLAVGILRREPDLDVIGLGGSEAHIAGTEDDHAIWDAEKLEYLLRAARHMLEFVVALLRR